MTVLGDLVEELLDKDDESERSTVTACPLSIQPPRPQRAQRQPRGHLDRADVPSLEGGGGSASKVRPPSTSRTLSR